MQNYFAVQNVDFVPHTTGIAESGCAARELALTTSHLGLIQDFRHTQLSFKIHKI